MELDNEYIMSPKDLCTIDFLDQLADTGISVLKIEGRGRAPEYVATTIKCYREAIDSIADGTYSKEKVKGWMSKLETVYNRGFWGGYFLGQELGEWTDSSGSKATVKKVFLGKGMHYFSKAKIGQFKIEAQQLKVGDKVLITGPTTGVVETTIETMRVDDVEAEVAKRGSEVTFMIDEVIRSSDKLYKIVPSEQVQD